MSTPERSDRLLRKPEEVWRFLLDQGGLDPEGYDSSVVDELRMALGLQPGEDVKKALKKGRVSVERFIPAFFAVVQPFSQMMTDLLNAFSESGAKRGAHNLRVNFDFESAESISFDLNQFKDWIESWTRQATPARLVLWSSSELWALSSALRVETEKDLVGMARGSPAESWVAGYMNRRVWPTRLPDPPRTGIERLDRSLREAWRVWRTVMEALAAVSRNRDHLREVGQNALPSEPDVAGWSIRDLYFFDTDHWGAFLAGRLYKTAEHVGQLEPADRMAFAMAKAEALEDFFDRLPAIETMKETLVHRLVEFLNLPLWKRRHELYSAWIWTQILAAVDDAHARVHQVDETIRFSFSGSHLATWDGLDPPLHLWAELRSALAAPALGSSRKRGMQPDYTILTDPVSAPESAVLVVECKQYKAASRRNFRNALVDYARGRPTADVILANYGPVPDDLLTGMDPTLSSIAGRARGIGYVRPNGAGQEKFRDDVRASVLRRCCLVAPPVQPSAVASGRPASTSEPTDGITLSWKGSPLDLDLWVHAASFRAISFENKGSLEREPWLELDTDARHGSGSETVLIGTRLPLTYRCYVHNYSADSPLAGCGARTTLRWAGLTLEFSCPETGNGRYWHVCDIDGRTRAVHVVNVIVDGAPPPPSA